MYKSIITLTLLLANGMSAAAEWSLTSKLDPSVKYDDNVFLSENEQSSVQYSISPTLIAKRSQEDSEVSLTAGYNVSRYTSISNLNRQDPFIQLNGNLKAERSQYGLAASYNQASSRSIAEQDTGDFSTESTVTSESVSPSYRYQLTERDSLSIGASYSSRTYSTSNFGDTKTKSVNSGWQHQFSERLSAGFNLAISNYQSDGLTISSDDDNYNLSTDISYNLSEIWVFGGQVGIRKLKSNRQDSLGITENSSSTGSSFNLNASRKTELDSLSMGISRSLLPTNTGDVNEQDRINLDWSRNITEHISTNLSASYLQSTSALSENSEQRDNINFSPSIKWQFERNLGLNFAYNYRQQKRSTTDTNVSSNSIMMTLIYDWDGIRVSR